MTCAELDLDIDAYLRGDLDDQRATELELHAASCARCEAVLDAATIPGVMPDIAPPPTLRADTLAAVQRARTAHGRRRWTLPVGVAAAAVLVLMVLQPAPKRAADNPGNPVTSIAESRARPELAELDAAERELNAALQAEPDDADLRGYLAAVTARRAALTRLVREASL